MAPMGTVTVLWVAYQRITVQKGWDAKPSSLSGPLEGDDLKKPPFKRNSNIASLKYKNNYLRMQVKWAI